MCTRHNAPDIEMNLRSRARANKGPINQLRTARSESRVRREEEFRKSNFGRDRYWLTCTSEDSTRTAALPSVLYSLAFFSSSLSRSLPPHRARSPFILGLQPRRKRESRVFLASNARYPHDARAFLRTSSHFHARGRVAKYIAALFRQFYLAPLARLSATENRAYTEEKIQFG